MALQSGFTGFLPPIYLIKRLGLVNKDGHVSWSKAGDAASYPIEQDAVFEKVSELLSNKKKSK